MGALKNIRLTGQAVVPQGAQEPAVIAVAKETPTMNQEQYLAALLKANVPNAVAKAIAEKLADDKADADSLAKVFAPLTAEVEKADDKKEPGEVVYKSPETGVEYTKDHEPAYVALAKQNDELIADRRVKDASTKYPHVPEFVMKMALTDPTVCKAIDENDKENDVTKSLTDLNRKLGMIETPIGNPFTPEMAKTADADGDEVNFEKYSKAVEKYAVDNSIDNLADARLKFRETPEGVKMREQMAAA